MCCGFNVFMLILWRGVNGIPLFDIVPYGACNACLKLI